MRNPELNVAELKIRVGLDKENVPEEIEWDAPEGQGDKNMAAKAFLLSVFDRETKDTLKMDLWTKEMQVGEMDRFFFQTLRAMTDSYHKATKNDNLAKAMQSFVQYFGEQTEILPKSTPEQ